MALNDFADSRVTVKKKDLLDTIRRNRDHHHSQFVETMEGYRETVIKRVEQTLTGLRAGGNFDPYEFNRLTPPQDHTKDYDRVIRMLEMSTSDEITCTEKQFNQYVLDEWTWKDEFSTSNALYSKAR